MQSHKSFTIECSEFSFDTCRSWSLEQFKRFPGWIQPKAKDGIFNLCLLGCKIEKWPSFLRKLSRKCNFHIELSPKIKNHYWHRFLLIERGSRFKSCPLKYPLKSIPLNLTLILKSTWNAILTKALYWMGTGKRLHLVGGRMQVLY